MTEQTKERADYEIAREELAALMKRHALRVASEFIPWTKSRNAPGQYEGHGATDYEIRQSKAKGWRSLNWRVTLQRTAGTPSLAKPRDIVTTDYSAGEGHCPAVKDKHLGAPDCVDRQNAIKAECETGLTHGRYSGGKRIHPDAVDVFASLVRDGRDAIEAGDFETWAAEFGYDTDSRKAETSYRACLDYGLKIRAAIGEKVMNEAAELASRL